MNTCNSNITERFGLLADKFVMNNETDIVDNGDEHILLINVSSLISPFNHDYVDSGMFRNAQNVAV